MCRRHSEAIAKIAIQYNETVSGSFTDTLHDSATQGTEPWWNIVQKQKILDESRFSRVNDWLRQHSRSSQEIGGDQHAGIYDVPGRHKSRQRCDKAGLKQLPCWCDPSRPKWIYSCNTPICAAKVLPRASALWRFWITNIFNAPRRKQSNR